MIAQNYPLYSQRVDIVKRGSPTDVNVCVDVEGDEVSGGATEELLVTESEDSVLVDSADLYGVPCIRWYVYSVCGADYGWVTLSI